MLMTMLSKETKESMSECFDRGKGAPATVERLHKVFVPNKDFDNRYGTTRMDVALVSLVEKSQTTFTISESGALGRQVQQLLSRKGILAQEIQIWTKASVG
jgi:hypothetical protein